ncbi:hypothetical protein PILCRDRAFT_810899 [Piloderma croceum F 1598]|uniref:Uncharacterized protein n=1 Tax=Piloderma croceum (strain F 1598) TaxID=765440 RepID=A0A0C3BYJ5_PILCF|nr:hypothetical protein PILCRDRAFT_810899 [Piloderma croceum F 1598]
MHNNGGRGTQVPSWNGEEAGPLSEEPQLYEFQLILDDVEPASEEPLRSFSPDFEIANDSVEGTDGVPRNEWPEYHARELCPSPSRRLPSLWDNSSPQIDPSPTGTYASLELEYPDHDQDQGASFQHRYLNGYATQHDISASTSYASSSSSSEMTQMSHRDPAPEHTWNDYMRSSRPGSSIGVSEPVHSMTSGSSPIHYLQTGSALPLSAARRWSLPSNPQAPFLL